MRSHARSLTSRRALVVANWKMYLRTEQAMALARSIVRHRRPAPPAVVLCPSYPALSGVGAALRPTGIRLGAQDVSPLPLGAQTGEVAAEDLRSLGCQYVIIGHSERRALGETDAVVHRKILAAIHHGLSPILCVGETKNQRRSRVQAAVVRQQVIRALGRLPASRRHPEIVIAYEPIWAIGTDRPARPSDAWAMADVIRRALQAVLPSHRAQRVRILYGGSVTPSNVASFVDRTHLHGVLLGRAALTASGFTSLLSALST